MLEILKIAFKSKKLVAFCIGQVSWADRMVGYIKKINLREVVISEVDVFGSIVSTRTVLLDHISIIEYDDNYNRHLEKLRLQAEKIKKAKPRYFYNKGATFSDRLSDLQSKGCVFTIFFGTEYITALSIKRIEAGILVFNGTSFYGTPEGQNYCRIECISKIRYDGPAERKIAYLLG